MPRYRVEYKETRAFVIEIEAEDEEHARELASNGDGVPISDQFDSCEIDHVERMQSDAA